MGLATASRLVFPLRKRAARGLRPLNSAKLLWAGGQTATRTPQGRTAQRTAEATAPWLEWKLLGWPVSGSGSHCAGGSDRQRIIGRQVGELTQGCDSCRSPGGPSSVRARARVCVCEPVCINVCVGCAYVYECVCLHGMCVHVGCVCEMCVWCVRMSVCGCVGMCVCVWHVLCACVMCVCICVGCGGGVCVRVVCELVRMSSACPARSWRGPLPAPAPEAVSPATGQREGPGHGAAAPSPGLLRAAGLRQLVCPLCPGVPTGGQAQGGFEGRWSRCGC